MSLAGVCLCGVVVRIGMFDNYLVKPRVRRLLGVTLAMGAPVKSQTPRCSGGGKVTARVCFL